MIMPLKDPGEPFVVKLKVAQRQPGCTKFGTTFN